MTDVWERPRIIRTKKEYEAVMDEIHRLLDLNARKGSPEDERLDLLTLLAEDYETRTEPPIPPGKPQSVVQFMLEQKGLTRADLVKPLGGNSRVSEFLSEKRALSTNQIKALRSLLGIPADLLIEDPEQPSARPVIYRRERRRPRNVAEAKPRKGTKRR